NRIEIENFKTNLIQLLDRANDTESEEFHKNLVSDFLKDTYYKKNHFINTKGRNDLVIHNGNSAKNSVGVIVEAKKPTNKSEMVTTNKLNAKAFQELVLYYLRERITHKNLEVKHLVITNIYEWFIFDATLFDRLFAQNKNLVKQFNEFEGQRLSEIKTDFFYKQIAEPFIAEISTEIEFTYFNLQDYQKPLRNDDKADDNKLIALFKLLSPEHLLKQPFINDSNSLDKRFYSELLHIIGLTETKLGSKKLIDRNKEGERNSGSLLEDAMLQLDSLDKINRLNQPNQFGNTQQEKLFNVGLELVITWINRILFLKLLEAQLITYHKGDKSYAFLSLDKIKDYDDLNSLFFQVLAKKYDERNEDVKKLFEKVPYLNSSLFEPTEIEQVTLFISNLRDDRPIPVISSTVLKNDQGKKRTGELTTLQYLFEFLNAYDFSSEGSEEIQEDNKTLINASVLGLIFEKINGYKDGSFFTPGFITMYMCRETIRKAVVQKFGPLAPKGGINTIADIYSLIPHKISRKQANETINSIKICDPAVGSGHFLVSALNELIAIKNDLKILADKDGKSLHRYEVEVVNDELVVTDEEGELFEYNFNNKESQRIQETLFHEKQTLIENCLFGVDINPNSVKICRLRLWIELLKNAYYKNATELETLPNIDINIKCGNSLVSRFAIDADLSQALKKSKWNIDSYRIAVDTYRNAENKAQKREMEKLIADIKSDFRSEISLNDPKAKKLRKLSGDLLMLTTQTQLFEMGKKEKAAWNKKVTGLTQETVAITAEIEAIKSNKIFENAFEWRFEFPEVLNNEGDFMGFDVLIGNPPYIGLQNLKQDSVTLSKLGYTTFDKTGDLYVLFCERGNQILKNEGLLSFIIPNKWMSAGYGKNLRTYLVENTNPTKIIDFEKVFVFDEAVVFVCILDFQKTNFQNKIEAVSIIDKIQMLEFEKEFETRKILLESVNENGWQITSNDFNSINQKIENRGVKLKDWKGLGFFRGITSGLNEAFVIDEKKANEIIEKEPQSKHIVKKVLRGRNIKRFKYQFDDIYLLFVPWHFPMHNETEISNASIVAENKFDEDYPLVYEHLSNFKTELSNRNKAETGVRYEWYALQRHGASYSHLFEEEKIVWMEISDKANYAYDVEKMYITNSAYFLTGHSLKYLLAVLNSKVCDFYFFQKTAIIAGGRKRYTKQYVEQNPIPIISDEQQIPFIKLVDKLLVMKNEIPQADTTDLETQIDQLVYALYGLTEAEVEIVENASK
ncbi:MAG TPA: type II restriction endonuclease, partial [Lutibacter sp.]|nr:type II restriction endonuclease [Lutibacter sp.]